ncbi:hypothetical protein [Variovorax rhizosphaerae]|uniref:Ankyrin repeat domain-containing protein n=1 Tax=Variovorax rhizosphaerae TaxID=1836200 RepID=A0ABU8WMC7_9BURK
MLDAMWCMQSGRTPISWLCRQNVYDLHPTDAELAELNQTAGAMIIFDMKDKVEQERLLSHLIAAGLDINAPHALSPVKWTALHSAVIGSPWDVALLLNHGARTDIKDGKGLTPLDLALQLQGRAPIPERAEAIKLLQAAQAAR